MTPLEEAEIAANLATLTAEVKGCREDIREIKNKQVTQKEFEPIKKIVWGVVTAIVLGVLGLVLKSVGIVGTAVNLFQGS